MAAVTSRTRLLARRSTQARVALIAAYAAVTLLAILYAAPFLWMIATSLKDPSELDAVPPIWIPKVLQWQNYPNALLRPTRYFPLFFQNTAVYVGLSVLGQLVSCSLVAYGFARIPFKGSKVLFTLVLKIGSLNSSHLGIS